MKPDTTNNQKSFYGRPDLMDIILAMDIKEYTKALILTAISKPNLKIPCICDKGVNYATEVRKILEELNIPFSSSRESANVYIEIHSKFFKN